MAADANRRVGRGKARNRKARRARQAQPTCPTVGAAPRRLATDSPSGRPPSPGVRATYIGRVGALAVALGVGVLVTSRAGTQRRPRGDRHGFLECAVGEGFAGRRL